MLAGTQLSVFPDVQSYEIENPCSGGDISRPALRYFGGKWRIAPWIIDQFPEHTVYVEPYGGAFSVGLRKSRVQEAIYNELNPDVVNFFKVLKTRPRELITALNFSPRTKAEFQKCQRIEGDALEQARRFCLYCQMSFGNGGGRWSSGTSAARLRLVEHQDFDHLFAIAQRLSHVEIEQRDALDCIQIYDSSNTLFYVDPPYVQSTRGSKDSRHINGAPRRQYAYEMDDAAHRKLAYALHACDGMVVLSGYDSDLYRELFPGWRCLKKEARTSSRGQREECLWIKPKVGDLIWLPVSKSWEPGTIGEDGLIDFPESETLCVWGAWASRNCRQSPPEQNPVLHFGPFLVRPPAEIPGHQPKRKHRAKGRASGWLETRTGNKKRKNPSVSHYYRWDSPKGRVSEYVMASRVSAVRQMLEAGQPALEILKVVVDGKKKLSAVSAELLGK